MLSASPDRGRLKALGLLALVVAVLYLVCLHWWWTAPMLSMGQQLQDLREQELKLRMIAAQRPQIEIRLAAIKLLETNNPGFLPEASVELASAALAQRLESLTNAVTTDKAACSISQRTPTPVTTPESYQRVVVQVRMLCGMGDFSALLHSIESGRPQLFVDNLNIISRHDFADANRSEANGPLDISFDLYGYLRSDGSSNARGANAR